MSDLFFIVGIAVLASLALSLARVLRGPSRADRMMGAQLTGTCGVALLVLLAGAEGEGAILDAALILALLAALAAVGFVKSVTGGTGDPEVDE